MTYFKTHNVLNIASDLSIHQVSAGTQRKLQSKMISNDQELIQSDPTSCPENQKGNN